MVSTVRDALESRVDHAHHAMHAHPTCIVLIVRVYRVDTVLPAVWRRVSQRGSIVLAVGGFTLGTALCATYVPMACTVVDAMVHHQGLARRACHVLPVNNVKAVAEQMQGLAKTAPHQIPMPWLLMLLLVYFAESHFHPERWKLLPDCLELLVQWME